jgi:hypothetical protein
MIDTTKQQEFRDRRFTWFAIGAIAGWLLTTAAFVSWALITSWGAL